MIKRRIILFGLILLIGGIQYPKMPFKEVEETSYKNTRYSNIHTPHQPENILATEDPLQWMHNYGGTEEDAVWSVIQTTDGGFALAGSSGSRLFYKAMLIKTNNQGTVQWTQIYNFSHAMEVIQTADGGFVLAGTWNDEIEINSNAWLVKTDLRGEVQWFQIYDLKTRDKAESVIHTNDGGFVLGGFSASYGGYWDAWLVKFDVSGNHEWTKVYGGSSNDHLFTVIPTSDGGFAFVGDTMSSGEGLNDVWLGKTDDNGKLLWNHTFGGVGVERAYSMIQLADGGFTIFGTTSSYGAGEFDAWVLKTDMEGILQWNRTYGGKLHDNAYTGIQTKDGGFLLAGTTRAIGVRREDIDLFMVKLDASGVLQWNQTYGGEQDDEAWSVIQTTDGGFALAGRTRSYEAVRWDAWLVKTDSIGITPDIEVPNLYLVEIILLVVLTFTTSGVIYLYIKKKREARPKWRR